MLGVVVPYALSVHSFVDKVGGYAGLAAVVAVALLVIMFFVNARETSSLRHRAAEAEERLYRLEYYAEQVNRNAAAQAAPGAATEAAPAPAAAGAIPAPAPAAAAATAKTGIPAAPVGVGGPALSSATRLIPLPDAGQDGAGPARAAAAASAASSTVLQPTEAVPALTNGDGAGAAPPVAPPPSTVAAGGQPPTDPAAAQDPPPAPPPSLTPRTPPPPVAPRRNYGRDGKGSRVGKGSFLVAALLLAIIIAAAVLVISRHDSSSKSTAGTHHHKTHHKASSGAKHSRTTNSPTEKKTKTVRVNPTTVTVAVLNGTSTTNLAADVLSKLTNAGFQPSRTGNNPDQTETATVVGYLPGKRNQALAVASALGLQQADVKPVPTDSRAVVCSVPTTCPAQVVVVVGADLASQT
jgi:hypothetical protein